MKPRDENDLRCTAPRCRRWVDAGQGVQWIADDRSSQRYCWSCWVAKSRKDEKEIEKTALDPGSEGRIAASVRAV